MLSGYNNILWFLGLFSISVPFKVLSPSPNYSWIRVTRQGKLRINQHWKILTWIEFFPITYIPHTLCKTFPFHPFPTIFTFYNFTVSLHSVSLWFVYTMCRSPDGSCVLTNSDDNVLRIFNLPVELYNGTAVHGLSEMVCIVWFISKVAYVTMACLCTVLSLLSCTMLFEAFYLCKMEQNGITPNYSAGCSLYLL